jgi:large subunit ribosomal protein L7/L12
MLSPEAKEDLIKRCKYAHAHGFAIASAEEYAKELGYAGEVPPHKVKRFSPAHLLHLARGTSGVPEVVPVPVPAPAKRAETKTDTPKAKAKKAEKSVAPPPPPPVEPEPRQEDIPTVPVDIKAIHATVAAMRAADNWDVVLVEQGTEPIKLVRELREITGDDLRDIEMLIAWLPTPVKKSVPRAEAEAIQKRLEAVGAKTELSSSTGER